MSLRKAVNAKCKECIYDPKSGLGSWRKQVSYCRCTSCPLYDVRPKTSSKEANFQIVSDKSNLSCCGNSSNEQ